MAGFVAQHFATLIAAEALIAPVMILRPHFEAADCGLHSASIYAAPI